MASFKYQFILFVPFICLHAAQSDDLELFKQLSDLNEKWMKANTVPETAMFLQQAPYSYHAKNFDPNVIMSDLFEKNETTAEGSVKSCSDDLLEIVYNIKSGWAKQMLDSDGKISPGILRGGLIWPGHFDECNSVYAPKSSRGHGDFHGKYCVTTWNLDLGGKYSNLSLALGICVPDSCSASELKTFSNNVVLMLERYPLLKIQSSAMSLTDVTCKLKDKEFDPGSIIYLAFVSFFVLLVVIGSIVSLKINRKKERRNNMAYSEIRNNKIRENSTETSEASTINSSPKGYESCSYKASLIENPELGMPTATKMKTDSMMKRIFLCFSAIENGKKILNTNVAEGQLESIHGIRFLSLTWVILGHTYVTSVPMIGNKLDVLKDMDTLPYQVILQAPFSVDSFFLLSGFLLTYLFLKEADRRNGKISWLYFYVHRFWRLTPAYLIVVFFYMFVFKYLGSGPFWDDNHCVASHGSWWKYLLYINNFIPIKHMCVGWSWYLANDMQFYIISPLFLYPLWRWPHIGLGILASILIATWTITGILSYKYDLIPMFVGVVQTNNLEAYIKRMWDSFDLIYDKPYCRIAPYIIGAILGYMLYKNNGRKHFLTWWQQSLGWIIASFCSSSVVFGLYRVEMSQVTSLFYIAFCRSSFSIGLAWVIFVCETGHGGFITKLLSWGAIIPFSRLTYCAYLLHPILIHGYYQAYPTDLILTEFIMVTNFMGFLLMSYGLAFLFSLAFESPMMNLEKMILGTKSRQKISTENETRQEVQ